MFSSPSKSTWPTKLPVDFFASPMDTAYSTEAFATLLGNDANPGKDFSPAIRIVGMVLVGLSLLPLGVAAYWYDRTGSFLEKAVRTEATVVDMEERRSSDGPMYYPIFSFTDGNGDVHEIRSSFGENPPSYRVGDAIGVYYDPDKPGENKLDRFVSLWLGSAVLGFIGLLLFGLGCLVTLAGPVIVRSVYKAGDNGTALQPKPYGETSYSTTAPPNALEMPDEEARTWSMLSHMTALSVLAGIPFGNILAPLVIWLWKRRASPLVDANAKESLNFQISVTLYGMASILLCFILIGFVLMMVLLIADVVLVILASLKADKGGLFRYPCTLRFIR